MANKNRDEYGRNELLYDPNLLGELVDRHGNAIEVKQEVKTPAFIYEIRTAVEYWFGGSNNHRMSNAIWDRCEAVDEGNLTLVGDTIKYEEDVAV